MSLVNSMGGSTAFAFALSAGIICALASSVHGQNGYFGAAEIDITPTTPIRLSGYAGRTSEATGIQRRLFAKAAAFGTGVDTSIMIAVDCTGMPNNVADVVGNSLSGSLGIRRERVVVSATHTHSGPCIDGYAENLFGGPLPADQEQRIVQYTQMLTSKLETVAIDAVTNQSPGHSISYGVGSVGFGVNRRNSAGPVDHDLPVLRVTDASGITKAIVTSYAAHAVTLNSTDNLISGDWPGYARDEIEAIYPDAIALVMIGAAGDINPGGRKGTAVALNHGKSIANEVKRMINNGLMAAVSGKLRADHGEVELHYATHREPGDPANARLAPAPGSQDYGITTWSFGDEVAMVFLEGEATVDYSKRLKSLHNDGRMWVNAYTNDVQGYIPSERILYEGGYEADDSGHYNDQPGRWAHGIEDKIVNEVVRQLDPFFSPVDRLTLKFDRNSGMLSIANDWNQPIEFDAYTIESHDGRLSGNWSSLADQGVPGWDEADNSNSHRRIEFNPADSSTLIPGGNYAIGKLLTMPAPDHFGEEVADADLHFDYHIPGEDAIAGRVEFVGLPDRHNNLVLTIDPETGHAAIQNESPHFGAAIDGYSITSNSGRLQTGDGEWHSLADQDTARWDEADNSNAHRITEFNPSGALTFLIDSDRRELGAIVDVGGTALSLSDFAFQFSLVSGEVLSGIVQLGELSEFQPGDFDRNGEVDLADYNVWKSAFGNAVVAGAGADGNQNGVVEGGDYTIWRDNLSTEQLGGAAAVPEPQLLAAWLIAALLFANTHTRSIGVA